MKYNIRGDKLEVTSAIENYVENKLDRLNKYFQNDEVVANVLLKVRGREQIIEVTIPADKYILRGEVGNDDLYSAIDLVTDKLERQIRKNKTRLSNEFIEKENENKDTVRGQMNFFDSVEENDIEDESIKYNIVKRKTLEMKPMDEEEAILEMNLLGHDFFVYKDMHSDNICILYKRKDGEYGILETK